MDDECAEAPPYRRKAITAAVNNTVPIATSDRVWTHSDDQLTPFRNTPRMIYM